MKKYLLISGFLLCIILSLTAQVPHSFNYQAIVRDMTGAPVANRSTRFQISLLLGSELGPASYVETHLESTNYFGLVTLQIGNGTVVSGIFDTLRWSSQSYYIKVEADTTGGTSYTDMGTVQLLAVPYALHAEGASNTPILSDKDGDTKIDAEETPDDDQLRFYNNGEERMKIVEKRIEVVNPEESIYIGDSSGASGSGYRNVFIGRKTGIRNSSGQYNVFIGDSSGTANETGFNNTFIGPWSGTSNITGEGNVFLGADAGEMNTTGHRNIFLGWASGMRNKTGYRNIFIGISSGAYNDSGSYNTYIGRAAGQYNTGGNRNVFLGDMAGRQETGSDKLYIANSGTTDPLIYGDFSIPLLRFNAWRIEVKNPTDNLIIGNNAGVLVSGGGNVFLGSNAGFADTTGSNNVYIGNAAGYFNGSGSSNVFVGDQTGYNNTTGNYNVLIGMQTGYANTTGNRNTFVGTNAGFANTTGLRNAFFGLSAGGANVSGSYNTYLGRCAGWTTVDGSYNVFIGNFAGAYEMGSNKLYISNSETSEPLIYGDFATKKLKFWADTLELTGNLYLGGALNIAGDINSGHNVNAANDMFANGMVSANDLSAAGEVRAGNSFVHNGNPGINDTISQVTAFDFVNLKLKYRTSIYSGGIIVWMSEESDWADTVGDPVLPPYENMGMVGEFTAWGIDPPGIPDHEMTRNANPYLWTTVIKLTSDDEKYPWWPPDNVIESKFRENQNWNINWGNNTFPTGTGIHGGPNIPVPLNASFDTTIYYVTFNTQTREYTFEDLSGYCPDSLTDSRDGKKYDLVLIGNQCWMAQNLNIGTRIDGTADQTDNSTTEKYCYNDLESSCDDGGGFYQWDEAMGYNTTEGDQGICPDGFHLPTDQELKTLEGMADSNYGVGDPEWNKAGCRGSDAGTNLKSTGGWDTGCTGIDALGFKVLSTGYRNTDGSFTSAGTGTFLWSSSQRPEGGIWPRNFSCWNLICRDYDSDAYGWSVRCIKN